MRSKANEAAKIIPKDPSADASLTDAQLLAKLLCFADSAASDGALAEDLLLHFGGFCEVFRAKYDELKTVNGMTDNTAVFLLAVGSIYRGMMRESAEHMGEKIDNIQSYFLKAIGDTPTEELWLAGFNENGALSFCKCIFHGAVDRIDSEISLIAQTCAQMGVSCVSVAHNHPTKSNFIDDADDTAAFMIGNGLAEFGIVLMEYIVVDRDVRTFSYAREFE